MVVLFVIYMIVGFFEIFIYAPTHCSAVFISFTFISFYYHDELV